jgi:hypothetical protein
MANTSSKHEALLNTSFTGVAPARIILISHEIDLNLFEVVNMSLPVYKFRLTDQLLSRASTMPKAASTTKELKTTKRKAVNRKATFVCGCIGGCKGRKQQISEVLYKKHTKFRELEGSENSLQVERLNETIVSFRTKNPARAVPHSDGLCLALYKFFASRACTVT